MLVKFGFKKLNFRPHCSFLAVVMILGVLSGYSQDYDKFGGVKSNAFEPKGFFRLERDPERWWLVSPEGNAFLLNAMDHCHQHVTNRSYNRDHWNKQWNLESGANMGEREEAFYKRKVAEDRAYLGFNVVYSHTAPVGMDVVPYMPRARTLNIEYWRTHNLNPRNVGWQESNFLDVFSSAFEDAVRKTAETMMTPERRNDPWLVAWLLTDSPVLVPYEARPFPAGFYHKPLPGTITWPVRLRNLGATDPGKQAYVSLMKERYSNKVEDFNAAYNTAFTSWDALALARDWRPVLDERGNVHEERDNHAFLLKILDRAWGTQARILSEADPNHMVWGDTLNLNSPIPDDVLRLYAKHFPVIVYQFYGATIEDHLLIMDRLRKVVGDVPVFSADSSWSVPQPPEMPDTLGPQCANYSVAADRMDEVYRAAYARPDFLGWGWCGWMDQWESAEPIKQHGGLQDAFGNWHQPLADRMAKFGREIYQIAAPK